MTIGQAMAMELVQEAENTRKMIARVPEDKFAWQPHAKSFNLQRLASHVATLYGWGVATIEQNEYVINPGEEMKVCGTAKQLMDELNHGVEALTAALNAASDDRMREPWTLRFGDQVIFQLPRLVVMRGMIFNHLIHHRGQLGVYLRLLDIPLPAIYGPSADEQP